MYEKRKEKKDRDRQHRKKHGREDTRMEGEDRQRKRLSRGGKGVKQCGKEGKKSKYQKGNER